MNAKPISASVLATNHATIDPTILLSRTSPVRLPSLICKRYYTTKNEGLKSLHSAYIKDLYKDRSVTPKAFDDTTLATLTDISNKEKKAKFVNE